MYIYIIEYLNLGVHEWNVFIIDLKSNDDKGLW